MMIYNDINLSRTGGYLRIPKYIGNPPLPPLALRLSEATDHEKDQEVAGI